VVELSGSVPSLSPRRLAEAIAWWISGCRNVVNALRAEPPQRDGNDEVADAVGLVLEIDPALPGAQPIGVAATFGVVTLRGTLHSAAQRQRAEHDAWCVDGVREVRNAIEVAA
jgi:osmotically-inducible protein OsmY